MTIAAGGPGRTMSAVTSPPERRLPVRFVVQSFLGWVLGVLLAIVLAVAGDSVGIEGTQLMVGVGVGAGVGLVQGRVLRPWVGPARRWLAATVLGMATPFLVSDVLAAMAGVPFSLPACVAAGGVLTGCLQQRLLRPCVRRSAWWIAASALAWCGAGATVMLSELLRDDLPRGAVGALAVLGLWLSGGVVLGVVGGVTLGRLRAATGAEPV